MGEAEYQAGPDSPPQVREAVDDEFIRYYEDEGEIGDHLVAKKPTSFGLIEPRALWYRIPYLPKDFFVFGESHAAVRGIRVKEASNIRKPILDESLVGWAVGDAAPVGSDSGIDENSSKLFRALEAWNPETFAAAPGPRVAAPVPGIRRGETSTRDSERGTYRLVVHGEGGEEWWKPSGQAQVPPSTHDFEGEVLSAIKNLFERVFEKEIRNFDLDDFGEKVPLAWTYFKEKRWLKEPDPRKQLNVQIHVRNHLLQAARTKASQQYATLRSSHGAVTKPEHGARQWTADDYRNEFMFARVLDVAGSDTHAFATMGDAHLGALQDRFSAQNIPFVRMQDFFGRFSRDAVDTRAIAYDKSPGFRTNRRMTLWLQCALAEYPNLQQWHLDELTESDFGEFAVTGKVTKWESEHQEGESRYQHLLVRLIRDIEKEYPNGEQYISDLTFAQFGEFLLTGNIAAWNAMEN